MFRLYFIAATCSLALVASASAATLQISGGTATVNTGQGFKSVPNGATINPGDTVMVTPGAAAQIVHTNGCAAPAPPGGIVTVGTPEQCAQSKGQQNPTQAVDNGPPVENGGGIGAGTIAVAAGVVVAVGAGVFFATQGDKKTSP